MANNSDTSKGFFIFINFIILIFSGACIFAAVVMAFIPNTDLFYLQSWYQSYAEIAARERAYEFPKSDDALKDLPLVNEIGIALLVLGIVLSIVSILGCFGPCCSCLKDMMLTFAIVTCLLMTAEVVVVTMFLVPDSPLHQFIRRNLKEKLQNHQYGQLNKDSFSLAMDMVNYYHHCCGIDGTGDYKYQPPISCTETTQHSFYWVTYNKEGCYSKLTDSIQENILWAGLGFGGLLLFQFVVLMLAVVIYKKSNKVSPI